MVKTVRLDLCFFQIIRAMQMHSNVMPTGRSRAQPIEPNSFLAPWYRCLRALGLRQRGLYTTKDTFVTTALHAGAKPAWLE